MPVAERPRDIRVLAWPARRNARENSFNTRLSSATSSDECTVEEFSVRASFLAEFDVLHIHWPDALLKHASPLTQSARLAVLTVLLFWVRVVRRAPVVWTVHNLAPHNGASAWAVHWLRLVLALAVSHQIHLTRATATELARVSPRLARQPFTVIPHGTYDGELPPPAPSARQRRGLAAHDYVIGFLGTVTPYKGADRLAAVFAGWNRPEARLIIAGGCADDELRSAISEQAAGDVRISTRFGWLGHDELAELLDVCDLVAFPYQRVLNSGSVMLALTAGKPVLAPRLGSLVDIQDAVGPAWMHLYDGELSVAVLQECSARAAPDGLPDLTTFSWPAIGRAHRSCYQQLLERHP